MNNLTKRYCPKCGKVLSLSDFYDWTKSNTRNRHSGWCKPCHRADARRKRSERTDRLKRLETDRTDLLAAFKTLASFYRDAAPSQDWYVDQFIQGVLDKHEVSRS